MENLRGKTGHKGEPGETGQKGETGHVGDRGITGDTGHVGDRGITGDTGHVGDRGITGDTGPKGDTGASLTNNQLYNLIAEISTIKRDITVFEKYFIKIDTTVDKLTEVLDSIKSLVTIHDNQLGFYKETFVELKNETSAEIIKLEEKIDLHVENNNKAFKEITAEITDFKNTANQKIQKLEFWRYLIVGGAIVAGFFMQELFSNVFHKAINPQQTTVQLQVPEQQIPQK
jgi:prefoldin subunit 5